MKKRSALTFFLAFLLVLVLAAAAACGGALVLDAPCAAPAGRACRLRGRSRQQSARRGAHLERRGRPALGRRLRVDGAAERTGQAHQGRRLPGHPGRYPVAAAGTPGARRHEPAPDHLRRRLDLQADPPGAARESRYQADAGRCRRRGTAAPAGLDRAQYGGTDFPRHLRLHPRQHGFRPAAPRPTRRASASWPGSGRSATRACRSPRPTTRSSWRPSSKRKPGIRPTARGWPGCSSTGCATACRCRPTRP